MPIENEYVAVSALPSAQQQQAPSNPQIPQNRVILAYPKPLPRTSTRVINYITYCILFTILTCIDFLFYGFIWIESEKNGYFLLLIGIICFVTLLSIMGFVLKSKRCLFIVCFIFFISVVIS